MLEVKQVSLEANTVSEFIEIEKLTLDEQKALVDQDWQNLRLIPNPELDVIQAAVDKCGAALLMVDWFLLGGYIQGTPDFRERSTHLHYKQPYAKIDNLGDSWARHRKCMGVQTERYPEIRAEYGMKRFICPFGEEDVKQLILDAVPTFPSIVYMLQDWVLGMCGRDLQLAAVLQDGSAAKVFKHDLCLEACFVVWVLHLDCVRYICNKDMLAACLQLETTPEGASLKRKLLQGKSELL